MSEELEIRSPEDFISRFFKKKIRFITCALRCAYDSTVSSSGESYKYLLDYFPNEVRSSKTAINYLLSEEMSNYIVSLIAKKISLKWSKNLMFNKFIGFMKNGKFYFSSLKKFLIECEYSTLHILRFMYSFYKGCGVTRRLKLIPYVKIDCSMKEIIEVLPNVYENGRFEERIILFYINPNIDSSILEGINFEDERLLGKIIDGSTFSSIFRNIWCRKINETHPVEVGIHKYLLRELKIRGVIQHELSSEVLEIDAALKILNPRVDFLRIYPTLKETMEMMAVTSHTNKNKFLEVIKTIEELFI